MWVNYEPKDWSLEPARIRALVAHVMAQPDVRCDRVEALQEAIERAEYAISDSQLADALMRELCD
jgi:anti-sigma28 factor (negative regulator of flagellin synthesis)